MDSSQTFSWSQLLYSILSLLGTLAAFVVFLNLLSYFSNFVSRYSIKRQFYFSILPDAEGNKQVLSRFSPVILQINLHGMIGSDALNFDLIASQLVESRLKGLGERIKGILLHFDSPGGSVKDTDAIYRHLKAYKEKYQIPIYAYVEGYCASGGLYIACAADQIFASPSSIVGSVGVRHMLPFFNVSKVLERWDIGVKTLAAGKHKDHLNPFRPWKTGEESDLKGILEQTYNRFVEVVIQSRKKVKKEQLVEELGAQIFTAADGVNIGFLDHGDSDRSMVLLEIAQAAGIKKGVPIQVIELIKKKPWFKGMLENSPLFHGKIKIELSPISDEISYL